MSECSKRLNGRSAIITGASQGLGEALALRLAGEGCSVCVVDINADGAESVAAKIREATGQPAIAHAADVTDQAQVGDAVKAAVGEFGKLDIIVCNAAILIAGATPEFDPDKWRKVIDVNLVGYFVSAQAALRVMEEQGKGVVVQINSKSGKKGSSKNSAYAASKFGGIGLTQSLALEYAEQGIRVNSICPGNLLDSPLWVDSLYAQYAKRLGIPEEEVRQKYVDQVPMKRGCSYEDVANALVFLCSDDSSYMTGQAINVTGGQQLY
ncbi:MAG TPA: sorbitol-6-phosphate dehydrogenase [Armatimonadota bacterium]|nr:sorbitol-6-phosphate dehydrogenase [Armatimonadota bacterium]